MPAKSQRPRHGLPALSSRRLIRQPSPTPTPGSIASRSPEASEALREFLAMPPLDSAPMIADPLQEEARAAIRVQDTILIAPTGYGKSWVAYEAARDVLGAGGRVFYTTPLKALSNQKFLDLRERFGDDRVGIVTGDRRDTPSAPIVVLTTEILRAILQEGDRLAAPGSPCLIVLDECHWLADPERGTTWEEVIIFAPPAARLLLLSASVGNGAQLGGWLESVRGHVPRLLTVTARPVPQRWGIWHNGAILPLALAIAQNRASGASPPWPRIVEALKRDGLTPTLVFLPTRRGCDAAVDQCLSLEGVTVIAHHAGMTFSNRTAIERDLQEATLDVVFCTMTLASGIDAPVKTVVLGSLADGLGRPLSSTKLQQMAGRAGRRGRDSVGFVIALASSAGDLERIDRDRESAPATITSAFVPTYPTVLQLIERRGRSGAQTVAAQSFATFQNADSIAQFRELATTAERERDDNLARLQPRSCADPAVTWFELMASEQRYASGRSRADVDCLRGGYLSLHGIAFARDPGKDSRALILTRRGTIEEWPQVPPPTRVSEAIGREVLKLIASLRSAPAGSPQIDSWFAFGTPNGAQSIEKVRAIDRERVSCGGAGSYLRSRLSGKRVHLLDPVRHGPAVARLLEQSVADDSGEPLGPESLPCARCPVLDTCSVAANGLASANRALAVSQQELRKIDPEARVLTLARALRQLGALDEQDHLTDLGRALRNLHGRAGLFFALARGRLADLSPEGLALVVGATREVRVGYVPARTDLLPAYFVEEVNRAIEAETAAGGMDRLVPLGIDAQRQSVDGSGRSAVRPSFSDRRAFVLERLWSGREVDEVGISPGDAERLLLDTLAFLGNLEGIPELHGAARQASEHLRSIAGHVPE